MGFIDNAPADLVGLTGAQFDALMGESEDDFDAEAAAELIPLAWIESLGDAGTKTGDEPVSLGFVPSPGSASADRLRERILDCTDANWLLVLAVNHPEWAEHAMRQIAALCKATPTWANWLQHCQDVNDEQREAA